MRFIELTCGLGDYKVFVDADSIVAVVEAVKGSRVFAVNMTSKGFEVLVDQEPHEVMDLINELRKEHM